MVAHRKLLGVAASLRNARWAVGNRALIDQLASVPDKDALVAFVRRESELHLENFLASGRAEGKAFTEIYANLHKSKGGVGLSNSEVALAAALWAASREGVAIDHISLASYFTAEGSFRHEAELRRRLLEADGILISSPVYFGDRGSLAESLIDFIARDNDLRAALAGRLYGGIAVGAKRNGGQETTLIYQMMDMVEIGLIAVGNDHETTAQYGGTGHAGDVGTMHKDKYGLDTSMGVGRRMAHVLRMLGSQHELADRLSILFLVLRDSQGIALREVEALAARFGGQVRATILDVANSSVRRCIACDICPTHVGVDDSYRCIIKSKYDDFADIHKLLLHHDVIVPVVAAVRDRRSVISNYQNFIERTRYLRRGDYALGDVMVAPLIFEEIGAYHSYQIRTMTSFVRHHTVLSRPIIGKLVNGALLDVAELNSEFARLLGLGERLAAGRLSEQGLSHGAKYNPVGYVLSADKDIEDETLALRAHAVMARERKLEDAAMRRLGPAVMRQGAAE